MKPNILVTIGNFTPEAKKLLEECGQVDCKTLRQEELTDTVTDYDVLVVQLGLQIDKKVIDAASSLKVIATATTGLDHIDIAYARSKGIEIVSLKDETEFLNSITSTAELACGLMIALVRNTHAAHQSVLKGKWDRENWRGHSLSGKTLGIIGFGRLGKMMATYGEALGMNVVLTDPDADGSISIKELLKVSDIISLHVHLTEDTEGLICEETLKLIKPGAVLVNTARGKLVDEKALIKALDNGNLAGFATDVLADEHSFTGDEAQSSLIEYAKSHDNVIITPHIGGTTVESREATDIFIAKKVLELMAKS